MVEFSKAFSRLVQKTTNFEDYFEKKLSCRSFFADFRGKTPFLQFLVQDNLFIDHVVRFSNFGLCYHILVFLSTYANIRADLE